MEGSFLTWLEGSAPSLPCVALPNNEHFLDNDTRGGSRRLIEFSISAAAEGPALFIKIVLVFKVPALWVVS
jgi:hypothetical protein